MKKEIILAAWAALVAMGAFADRTIVEKGADGVNTITTTVNDAGYITSEATTLAHVQRKYAHPTDDESAEVRQVLIDLLASVKADEREDAANAAIVQQVFGEGTNSSFIVRRELTATQKRFLALGRHYIRLARAFLALNARVKVLEMESANRRGEITMEVK